MNHEGKASGRREKRTQKEEKKETQYIPVQRKEMHGECLVVVWILYFEVDGGYYEKRTHNGSHKTCPNAFVFWWVRN